MQVDESVEQQDSRGWTPIMWSSSNGYCKLVRQVQPSTAILARDISSITFPRRQCIYAWFADFVWEAAAKTASSCSWTGVDNYV